MTSGKVVIEQFAPIVLTAYKRPKHVEQTLRALRANDYADQSILYIYSDGPKHLATKEDIENINRVRQVAKSEKWCKEVHVIESPVNLGLVNSFIKGVTEVVNRHGKVIVLEDDQITMKGFLKYLNEALELYKDDKQVMHISAYMYPAQFESKQTTFFINVQSCPGWATWKRAWDLYNHDAVDHLKYFSQNKKRRREFDIDGHAYYYKQLERNAGPVLFSFAVRWYASCLRAGGLSLFPARSLVQNNGLDGSGEHCQPGTLYHVVPVDYLEIERIPLVEDKQIRKSVDLYYREHLPRRRPQYVRSGLRVAAKALGAGRIKNLLRRIFGKIFPELNPLIANDGNWRISKSVLSNSSVSPKAKLYGPYNIRDSSVGDFTYISLNSMISRTEFGKFCSVGPNVVCGWGLHPVASISTSPMFYSTLMQNGMTLSGTNKVQERKPIKIGNDVFIGMNVTILDGVSIGNGSVVGAGCVVSKDVPPYAIVVGNPMRTLRYRFPEETVKQFLEIAWWDWPEEELKHIEESFLDVEGFVARHLKRTNK